MAGKTAEQVQAELKSLIDAGRTKYQKLKIQVDTVITGNSADKDAEVQALLKITPKKIQAAVDSYDENRGFFRKAAWAIVGLFSCFSCWLFGVFDGAGRTQTMKQVARLADEIFLGDDEGRFAKLKTIVDRKKAVNSKPGKCASVTNFFLQRDISKGSETMEALTDIYYGFDPVLK
jgi:hypothetical protein